MACRPGSLASRIRILAIAILLPHGMASAQAERPVREARIDLAAGSGSNRHTAAASFNHQFAIAWDRRVRIGYGARYSFFGGSDLRFRTSDRGELNGNPADHALVRDPALHALNLAVQVSLRPLGGLELGFNIDVIGLGFGPERRLEPEDPQEPAGPGSPAGFNLLRGGVRDRGTLNSEFYAGWQVAGRFIVRAGLSHFVAEYSAGTALAGGSTRVRVDGNLAFLALGYRL